MKHKKLAKIATPIIAVLLAIAFAASPASATGESVGIVGFGYESDGITPVWFDGLNITNTNTNIVYNSTSPAFTLYENYYSLALVNGTDIYPGDILTYYAVNGTRINNTASFTWDGMSLEIPYDIIFPPAGPILQPDLTPTAVWDNPGKGEFLFANGTNDIKVNINNSGSANAGSFDVKLEIESYTETINVLSLAAGANTNVTFTGYTPNSPGAKTVNITVDSANTVSESNEGNNLLSTLRTVYNNGYKGARWSGGKDIVTVQTYDLKGNVNYSKGNSVYTTANWNYISASWSSTDLPIPPTATILSAKLYTYFNWDRTPGNALWGDNATFNSLPILKADAVQYSEMKGWGSYAFDPYGVLVYDVTSKFNTAGNTVTLGDSTNNRNVAVDGMILQVVYSDPNEPNRMIWINEGYDLLNSALAKYGAKTTETKAYSPFTGGASIELAKVASARLIATGVGVTDPTDKSNVIFNSNNHWDVLPAIPGGTGVSIANINVKSELLTSNEAIIHDNGDTGGMRAATTILVVEKSSGIKIDLGGSYDTEVGRHIMVPITANQLTQFYGTVNMEFNYPKENLTFFAIYGNPQSTVIAYNNLPGKLNISALNTAGVKGDVVLATVELEVANGTGAQPLSLAVNQLQDIYGTTIYNYVVPAVVNIANPTSDLKVESATSYPQSPLSVLNAILNTNGRLRHTGDNETVISAHVTGADLGIHSVTVNLTAIGGSPAALMSETSSGIYNVTAIATTGVNGSHNFTVTATDNGGNTKTKTTTPDLTVYRRGDVARNNIVDMGDALYIARYTVGKQTITNTTLFNFVGDLMPEIGDSTYKVDMGDALYIARYSVGLEPAP